VQIDGSPYLVAGNALLLWTPEGYARRVERPKDSIVTVLTPESMVGCFRQGYLPEIHESARAYVCEPERSVAVAGDNSSYQARTDHGGRVSVTAPNKRSIRLQAVWKH